MWPSRTLDLILHHPCRKRMTKLWPQQEPQYSPRGLLTLTVIVGYVGATNSQREQCREFPLAWASAPSALPDCQAPHHAAACAIRNPPGTHCSVEYAQLPLRRLNLKVCR